MLKVVQEDDILGDSGPSQPLYIAKSNFVGGQ